MGKSEGAPAGGNMRMVMRVLAWLLNRLRRSRSDLASWCEETLQEMKRVRESLDGSLAGVEYWTTAADRGKLERERALCELTRMVLSDGELLHALARGFVLCSGRSLPESGWTVELARRTEGLMRAAATVVTQDPYRCNCNSRLRYVQARLADWCPAFSRKRAAA